MRGSCSNCLSACMRLQVSCQELRPSFLRDWVAAVCGVGIPGNLEPGQAEACPHTAAMTRIGGHEKSASRGDGALSACAKFTSRFLHLTAGLTAVGGIYWLVGVGARGGVVGWGLIVCRIGPTREYQFFCVGW